MRNRGEKRKRPAKAGLFTSELFRQPCLFQNLIGRVARLDRVIYWKAHTTVRALPDFMITFAGADIEASGFPKNFLQLCCVAASHASGRTTMDEMT